MHPKPQLYCYTQKLTACALGEPSLTLVRNDQEFGLLVAMGAHEDSFGLHLDDVTYLRAGSGFSTYQEFDEVLIYQFDDLWWAQETSSRLYFPNPSRLPYHVIFISHAEHRLIQNAQDEDKAFPVFQSAQEHFGRLPGFTYRSKSLSCPDDYAAVSDALPPAASILGTD